MIACTFRCDGGMVPVTERHVAAELDRLDPSTSEAWVESFAAALRNSVSPCPQCRPEQYERWRGGHLVSGHSCDECSPTRRRRVDA